MQRLAFAVTLLLAASLYEAPPAAATPGPIARPATLGELGVPCFCTTRPHGGFRTDPVNLLVAASRPALEAAFMRAGWVSAQPIGPLALVREARALVDAGAPYPDSPMSDLYLFGRRQDYGLQKNAHGVRSRDHLRIWRTGRAAGPNRFWWAIAATRDVDIKFYEGLPTHRIAADIDAERDLVAHDLAAAGRATASYRLLAHELGYYGLNGARDPYFTDGEVVVLELDEAKAPTETRL